MTSVPTCSSTKLVVVALNYLSNRPTPRQNHVVIKRGGLTLVRVDRGAITCMVWAINEAKEQTNGLDYTQEKTKD